MNEGHEPANFQDKRWDAVKGNILFEVCTVQVQKKFATKKVASKEKTLARYVVQSPLTNNACHMISWPDEAGLVYINDLDMGEVHQVAFSDLVNAPMYREVEGDDFGFSWVAGSEHLSDDLYTWVMECIEDG